MKSKADGRGERDMRPYCKQDLEGKLKREKKKGHATQKSQTSFVFFGILTPGFLFVLFGKGIRITLFNWGY